jgi:hypothetical protein
MEPLGCSVAWQANPDWATLSIWRGGDPLHALAVAEETLGWWRSELKDMWNVVAVGGACCGGRLWAAPKPSMDPRC